MIASMDPRTGRVVEELNVATDIDDTVGKAVAAADQLAAIGRAGRAALLRSMAAAFESQRDDLVRVADRETALGPVRLNNELTRTRFQLELFADVVDDGAYLEATIDHAGDSPMGPRPDLRRMLLPLGPVAVFGASNFPFAFSVPGGDTASALAAGCPVVAKAHEAHPVTSLLSAQVLAQGARDAGVTADVIGVAFGRDAGVDLVRHPAIQAVGFTGSVAGGRALFDIASSRPSPIPFYGELGALNTLVVCPAAARSRAHAIGEGLAGSFTLGVGQFCTKPGIALVPAGAHGAAVVDALSARVATMSGGVMLSERTADLFQGGVATLRGSRGVEVAAEGKPATGHGWSGVPLVLRAPADAIEGALTEECFGPVVVVVEYADDNELLALLGRLGPALTGTVHADADDENVAARVYAKLAGMVGRVVWNGFPTGVAVGWAMHHGGPYPATTNALHTSVGASAIRRWLKPISLQDVPDGLLPDELRDAPGHSRGLLRRIDGVLTHVD